MFNTKKRINVGNNARKLVLSNHTWKKELNKSLQTFKDEKSRFLIIPKSNNFRDIINIKEIANELKIKGHDCITLTSQVSDKNLEFILKEEKFNCVFRVNKGKPEKVDRNIRFISWVSEISDLNECLDNFNENDLIYTLKKNE